MLSFFLSFFLSSFYNRQIDSQLHNGTPGRVSNPSASFPRHGPARALHLLPHPAGALLARDVVHVVEGVEAGHAGRLVLLWRSCFRRALDVVDIVSLLLLVSPVTDRHRLVREIGRYGLVGAEGTPFCLVALP